MAKLTEPNPGRAKPAGEAAPARGDPDVRHITAPLDIIGDVHGCADELEHLLSELGYTVTWSLAGGERHVRVRAPGGRRAVFVGDLCDRGPRTPDVFRIVLAMARAGIATGVPGNHDIKLMRWLVGKDVRLSHGLDRTVTQLAGEPPQLKADILDLLQRLPFHLWLDGGALAVAHAGIKSDMIGRHTGAVTSFCLYGETSGETDQFGLPVRYHWAAEYRGETAVVYGHTPVPEAEWVNNTLCIDTGCAFGGKLTALRWPDREIVSVPARQIYTPPVRPFGHPPVRPGVEG